MPRFVRALKGPVTPMYLQVFLIGLVLLALVRACFAIAYFFPNRAKAVAASIPPAVRAATLTASSHLLGVLATHAHTFAVSFGPEIVAAFADGQLDALERVNLERIVVTFLRSKLAPALLVEIEAMLGDEFEPWLLTQFRDQLVRVTGRTTVPSVPPKAEAGYALHRVLLSLALVTLVGVPLAVALHGCSFARDTATIATANAITERLDAYCRASMEALGRTGYSDGHHCYATGPHAADIATPEQIAAANAVRAQFAPELALDFAGAHAIAGGDGGATHADAARDSNDSNTTTVTR